MRRLTDNQSRHLCRWAFLTLCVLPTVLVIFFATRVWTAEDWELMIAASLNLDVEIERVENPLPGQTILHEVRLRRGQELLGKVRRIEWSSLGEAHLNLVGASLRPAGIEVLRSGLKNLGERLGASPSAAWRLSGSDLLVETNSESDAESQANLRLASCELLSSPRGNQSLYLLRIRFEDVAEPKDYPLELRITRGPTTADQQVFVRVAAPTPVWFLAALGCFPRGWDDQLLFQGSADFRENANGVSSGKVESAVLSNFDLAWLQERLGQPLSGRAEIHIPEVAWRDGRVVRADLQLHAADGELSPTWLQALARIPGLRTFNAEPVAEPVAESETLQSFRLFAARIQIASGTCRISPVAQSTAAICWDPEDQPLLAIDQPGYAQADLEVLARLSLEPQHPELLADDQLVELLSLFHLPPDARSARQPSANELR